MAKYPKRLIFQILYLCERQAQMMAAGRAGLSAASQIEEVCDEPADILPPQLEAKL